MRILGLSLLLVVGWGGLAGAAKEVEPNNHWLQATLIDGSEPVEGIFDDESDVYKLQLAKEGTVRVRLDGYPTGSSLTLEVLGFGSSESAPLLSERTGANDQLELSFRATGRVGYLALRVSPFEKTCQDQWCIMKMSADGPYYLLKSSPFLPLSWQGQPILPPPAYRIRLVLPQQAGEIAEKHSAAGDFSGLPPVFIPDSDLVFRSLPGWRMQSAAGSGTLELLGPQGRDNPAALIRVEVQSKQASPGSSAERQLNLAEKELYERNGEVRSRGEIALLGHNRPYLFGVFTRAETAVQYALMQIVVDWEGAYHRFSFICPIVSYQDNLPGFLTLLNSLSPNPSKPQREDSDPYREGR